MTRYERMKAAEQLQAVLHALACTTPKDKAIARRIEGAIAGLRLSVGLPANPDSGPSSGT